MIQNSENKPKPRYYCHHVSQMGLGSYAEMQCFPFSTDDAPKFNLKSSVTGSSTYKHCSNSCFLHRMCGECAPTLHSDDTLMNININMGYDNHTLIDL